MSEFTRLLTAAGAGDQRAVAELFALVYEDLRHLANRHLAGGAGHTLQPTALVHEVYLRVFKSGSDGGELP